MHTQPTYAQETTKAYLVTGLGVAEIPAAVGLGGLPPYANLFIEGSVNNTGEGTAFDAGLHVVAYAANGKLEVDMTVPLNPSQPSPVSFGWYVTDTGINAWLKSNGDYSSLQPGSLASGATVDIDTHIFHEGTVTKWTVTPVWTNSP
jgi:hypothetical protein